MKQILVRVPEVTDIDQTVLELLNLVVSTGCDRIMLERLLVACARIIEAPFDTRAKRITRNGCRDYYNADKAIRCGPYRILYSVENGRVVFSTIEHRGSVYRNTAHRG